MPRRSLLACLCLAACAPTPEVWTAPAVQLPTAEHAVALPLKRVAMLSGRQVSRWLPLVGAGTGGGDCTVGTGAGAGAGTVPSFKRKSLFEFLGF